jgi:hypothetical protein
MERNIYKIGKELFITNDEEIEKGDWFIENGININKWKMSYSFPSEMNDINKKVILTDNKDLIKDGVQAIDDEFLEWFVKNSSCESVEVQTKITKDGVWTDLKGYVELPTIHSIKYKIIIPKEEPKQKLPIVNGSYGCTIETEKQETIEEICNRLYNSLMEEIRKLKEALELKKK